MWQTLVWFPPITGTNHWPLVASGRPAGQDCSHA